MFKVLIFDLDDTICDTTKTITPHALKEAAEAMIRNGLNCNVGQALKLRHKLLKENPRTNWFKELINVYGFSQQINAKELKEIGYDAFYKRDVKEEIKAQHGAIELLNDCKKKFDLFLVTAGNQETQLQKINKLKISNYFIESYFADKKLNNNKTECFNNILKNHDYKANECLVIGNRIDTEIKDANALGMYSCLIQYGSYKNLSCELALEVPNFIIQKFEQLYPILDLKARD